MSKKEREMLFKKPPSINSCYALFMRGDNVKEEYVKERKGNACVPTSLKNSYSEGGKEH